jgi:hypothetical protein
LEAIRALPRRAGPYVFVSNRGTRYNEKTKITDFMDFVKKFGVTGFTCSHLSDGADTAASNAKNDRNRYAELLAGHTTGMKDKYVVRNPKVVLPATRAVYRHYFREQGKLPAAPCPLGTVDGTLPVAGSISADRKMSKSEIGSPEVLVRKGLALRA